MAATNPFRVSDLIAKYGWQIMVYLSNLGVRSLAEAQVLFVDSGHTNALDADDTEHGHSFEKPLATWDYAVGLLTADEGGVILMAPGHNENIGDGETIDNDVNGVVCMGLGTGTLRPRFDFDYANSTIDVGGNNVTFVNLTFRPGEADVLIAVDVEAGKTNFHMVDCEYLEGEGSGDEFLAAVELKAGCHNATIENNVFRAGWSSNPDDAVSLKGASNNVTIRNNRCSGPYGDGGTLTAAISNSTGTCLDLLIENNILKVKDGESGIELVATTPAVCRHNTIISTGLAVDSMIVGTVAELDQNVGITTDGTSGEFIKGGALAPDFVAYGLDHLIKTAVAAHGSMGTEITTSSILANLMTVSGDADDFSRTTHSLEAIYDIVNAYGSPTDVTAAVPNTPTANSLQDILSELDTANTYDNTTDSLEAISNLIREDIEALAGIQLDHLQALTTGVNAGADLSTYAVTKSLMAHIMSKTATTSSYDCQTDSLEAIADAVTGFTTAVSPTPTARSVQDILEKDSGGTFLASEDSLEAISDLLRTGTALLTGLNLDHFMKTAVVDEADMSAEIATGSALAHILVKGASGDVNDYDPTTDSLQAIRDNQQVAAAAALVADNLDHLLELDGTAAYAENIANDSIIAKIMCVGATATANTFDNTEDSLQAISEFVRTGATLGAGIQLDHLLKTTTGQTLDQTLVTYTADFSVMAHLMSKTAVGSTFRATTDSLEAIADSITDGTAILAGINLDHFMKTAVVDEADMSAEIATGSALAHILVKGASGDVNDYDPTTDSFEAISDKIGGFSMDGGTDYNDSVYACLIKLSTYIADGTGDFGSGAAMPANKSIYDIFGAYLADGGLDDNDTIMSHLDLIYADTAAIDSFTRRLHTRTLTNWGAAIADLWDVSAPVKAKIWGVVLVDITNQGTNIKLSATPTAPGGAVDICANLDIDNDDDGTVYKMNTTLGGAMVEVTAGVTIDDAIEVILPAGIVTMTSDANEAGGGSIQWFIEYVPLEAGAVVTDT